jgi:two-component system sensor histidine kinase TtrS
MPNTYIENSEKLLGYSDTVFRGLFEQSPLSIQISSSTGWILHANKACERLFGATTEMFNGYNILQDRQLRACGLMPQFEKGFAGETTFIPAFRYNVGSDVAGSEDMRWLRAIIQRERKNRLRKITDSMPALIAVIGKDYRYRFCNHTYEEWFGMPVDEIIGKTISDVIGPAGYYLIKKQFDAVIKGSTETYEGYIIYGDGSERYISAVMLPNVNENNQIDELFLLVNDRTSQKKTEEEAQHHQTELAHLARMSSISELATGLAHELNQPLTTIKLLSRIGLLQLEAEVTDHDKLCEALENIGAEAMRAGEIIRHLRRLVAKKNPKREQINLNRLITETVSFVGTETKDASVIVELDLEENLPGIFVDGIQIQQVLINLLLNSIDAIRKVNDGNGKITITSRHEDQKRARVTITDTGCGMDNDTLDLMFNSFFTTKGEKGIGIGLSICRSLIERHDGEIHAKSTLGKGTTLTFTLPFAD